MSDVFLYNGDLERGADLRFIEMIAKEKVSDKAILLLVTTGGSPDAAYKIGRYFQLRYNSFKVLIPGFCKSAGTLLAIGADELIFTPYGELGPLDIQMVKEDRLSGMESGLNISEAFLTLEQRAKDTFNALLSEIVQGSGGVVSFHTASHSATEMIAALYGPIFTRIDPEEVGSRSRAMRIGEDYGMRLNQKWSNLKEQALAHLSQSYPSHGFVIDQAEATYLFNNVRAANDAEMALVEELGILARHSQRSLTIRKLTLNEPPQAANGNPDETLPNDAAPHSEAEGAEVDGEDPRAAVAD